MKKKDTKRILSRGFTLLEMMVVVMIIGMLAAMVVPNLLRNKDSASQKKALADIVALESALDLYYLEHHRYPDTDSGLEALLSSQTLGVGYLKRLPKDPWGRPYLYRYPGQHGRVDIFTLGDDGLEGGNGAAADIGNWNVNSFQ